MTIDLTILEHQFFDPCWEPDDCSVLDTASGRLQIFCHFSQRLVAWVDSRDEAWVLINRARIGVMLRHLKTLEPDDFFHSWYANRLRVFREYIASKGFPASEGGAPEIDGADDKNRTTAGADFIKGCLGSSDEVVVEFTSDVGTPRIVKGSAVHEIDVSGLKEFQKRFISEHRIIEKARANVPLDNRECAAIEDIDLGNGIHSLSIMRKPAFQPQYPHEL
ncbi:hypothetical protein [Agrobacterium sp. NPDC090283]|uniref:hypothetical protein n=1 Tax=Agrobacterium sp. NPDC090283 TaxID=3363920 RepID=UPI003839E4DB